MVRVSIFASALTVAAFMGASGAANAAGDAAAGEKAYKLRCNFCHSPAADSAGKQGPSLFAVMGRKAGTAAGYTYSDAMVKSDITWDDATMKSYVAAPAKVVPGGKMPPLPAVPTDAQLDDIIAYLHTLK